MPKMDKQYQLILGTFIDDEFVWHDVDSFDNLEEAYRGFKKYVNSQLKYTDEELIKVWNTGRLDVELRRGNKLLNWVGIYAREVAQEAKEDEDEKADVKDSVERLFEDERGKRVTESELREEFEQMQADQPGEYNYSFEEYLKYKTGRHGTLKQIGDARPVSFTQQQFDEVLRLAEANIPVSTIAQKTNLTNNQVYDILKRYRYKQDELRFAKTLSEADKKQIQELYATGDYSQMQLAEKFGVSRWMIMSITSPEVYKNTAEANKNRVRKILQKSPEQNTAKNHIRHAELKIGGNANLQRFGTKSGTLGVHSRMALSPELKEKVFQEWQAGETPSKIAAKYDISPSSAGRIINELKNQKQFKDAQPLTFTRQQYRIVTEGLKEQKSDSNITNTDIARAAGVTPKIVELIKFRWQFIPEDKIPFVKESDDIPSPDWHHVQRERQELAEAVKAEAKLDKNKTRVGRKFGLTLSQVNTILGK